MKDSLQGRLSWALVKSQDKRPLSFCGIHYALKTVISEEEACT